MYKAEGVTNIQNLFTIINCLFSLFNLFLLQIKAYQV